jgi:hypothetical protein
MLGQAALRCARCGRPAKGALRPLSSKEKTMLKKIVGTMLSASFFVAQAQAQTPARVYFIEPKDGATVSSPVHVKFGVEGMKVAPAGTMGDNSGHHHLLIDGGPVQKGLVIPADDKSIHFGKGQTETDVKLPPGDHTLTMQFADGAHRSYGPEMSQTIKVHVK